MSAALLLSAFAHGLLLLLMAHSSFIQSTGSSQARTQASSTIVPLLSQKAVKSYLSPKQRVLGKKAKRIKPKPKKKKELEAPLKKAQVVEILPPSKPERPKNAKFLAAFDSKVDQQQVSAKRRAPSQKMIKSKRRILSPGMDELGTRSGRKKPPKGKAKVSGESRKNARTKAQPKSAKTAQQNKRSKLERESTAKQTLPMGDGKFSPSGRAGQRKNADSNQAAQKGGHKGAPENWRTLLPTLGPKDMTANDGSIDHIKDVSRGDKTFLNTRAYKHAWFFNRIKRSVRREWRAAEQYRRHDPNGRIFGIRDRYTIVDVTLKPNGNLEGVSIRKDSGVAVLDEAALSAFRTAQPFPNPPAGLIDQDGRIRFQFGFFLEIGGSSFKLFRPY